MKLLLDIGNSRLKIALYDQCLLGSMSAKSHNGDAERIADCLSDYESQAQVCIATVLSESFKAALADAVRARGFSAPDFVEVAQDEHGVHVAYPRPNLLGVDRWLSMVASRQLSHSDTVIVDCGTAVTFDAINRDGQHLGGLIMPGLSTMIRSLFERTARIPRVSSEHDSTLFATDTESAVYAGCLRALAAAIDGICLDMETKLECGARRLICGGDAELLMTKLRGHYHWHPDLVLQGMAIVAASR